MNHQIVYLDPRNSIGMGMNLLTFGFKHFKNTTRLKEISVLKKSCEKISLKTFSPLDLVDLENIIFDNLIDCVKISICFENFFKGLFLAKGYVVHKLDKNKFPNLYREQFKRPILFTEVLSIANWETNKNIQVSDDRFKQEIRGILKNTIGLPILTGNEYLNTINFSNDIMSIIKYDLNYRNNLHYYLAENYSISKNDYANFIKVIEYVNSNIVSFQNQFVDLLNKGDKYKVKKIEYSA